MSCVGLKKFPGLSFFTELLLNNDDNHCFPGAGVSEVAGKIPEFIKNQPKLNQSIWGQMTSDIKSRRGLVSSTCTA